MQRRSTYTDIADPFDRTNGNGSSNSTDDWLDEQSIYDNEWGSSAATTFNPNESSLPKSKREKFESLYEIHNGKLESSRRGDIIQSHIQNDTKMFMSVLEMPDVQRKRVLQILDNLDISSNNFGGRPYEKIILALCSLVADEALGQSPDPSVEDRLFLTDEFKDLMDCTKTSSSDVRKLRRDIREKSDYFQ